MLVNVEKQKSHWIDFQQALANVVYTTSPDHYASHPSSRHHAQHHLQPQLIVSNSANTYTNAIPRVQWKQMHCSYLRVGCGKVAGRRLKSTEPSLTADGATGGVEYLSRPSYLHPTAVCQPRDKLANVDVTFLKQSWFLNRAFPSDRVHAK